MTGPATQQGVQGILVTRCVYAASFKPQLLISIYGVMLMSKGAVVRISCVEARSEQRLWVALLLCIYEHVQCSW